MATILSDMLQNPAATYIMARSSTPTPAPFANLNIKCPVPETVDSLLIALDDIIEIGFNYLCDSDSYWSVTSYSIEIVNDVRYLTIGMAGDGGVKLTSSAILKNIKQVVASAIYCVICELEDMTSDLHLGPAQEGPCGKCNHCDAISHSL